MNFPDSRSVTRVSSRIPRIPLQALSVLIGESFDFRFYYFKKQFKASLEQFYIFPGRSVCMWTLDCTFELNLPFQKSSGLRPKNEQTDYNYLLLFFIMFIYLFIFTYITFLICHLWNDLQLQLCLMKILKILIIDWPKGPQNINCINLGGPVKSKRKGKEGNYLKLQ